MRPPTRSASVENKTLPNGPAAGVLVVALVVVSESLMGCCPSPWPGATNTRGNSGEFLISLARSNLEDREYLVRIPAGSDTSATYAVLAEYAKFRQLSQQVRGTL